MVINGKELDIRCTDGLSNHVVVAAGLHIRRLGVSTRIATQQQTKERNRSILHLRGRDPPS